MRYTTGYMSSSATTTDPTQTQKRRTKPQANSNTLTRHESRKIQFNSISFHYQSICHDYITKQKSRVFIFIYLLKTLAVLMYQTIKMKTLFVALPCIIIHI